MPYTKKQCAYFGANQSTGKSLPKDWKEHCKKGATKPARKKTRARKT